MAAEPLRGQRPLAVALVALGTTGLLLLGQVSQWTTGQPHVAGSDTGAPNVNLIGKSLYTTYLFPFEATSALLIIAVVGAVVLARRPPAATSSRADRGGRRRPRRRGRRPPDRPADADGAGGPATARRPTATEDAEVDA